jgi:arginase
VMRAAVESGRAVGLEITIYNPKLDPDGAGARGLTNAISHALAGINDKFVRFARPLR